MLKWLATGLWVVALMVGTIGLWQRFTLGHEDAGYGSYIPWGIWVVAYAFGVGISAGASMIASTAYAFGLKRYAKAGPMLLWLSLVSLACGMLLAVLDLGKTEKFWKILVSPQLGSIMAWLLLIYGAFGLITLIQLVLALKVSNSNLLRSLSLFALPVAAIAAAGEGALFGTIAARPFWNTPLLPVVFLSTAAVSGIGITALISAIYGSKARFGLPADIVSRLGKLILALIALNVIIEALQIGVQIISGTPGETGALKEMLSGSYAGYFWGVFVIIGSAIPAILLLLSPRSSASIGIAGTLAAIGTFGLRLSILIPGMMIPEFTGLERAFVDPRLVFTYTPSVSEWTVTLFAVCLAIGLVYVGLKILPQSPITNVSDNGASKNETLELSVAHKAPVKVSGGSQ